jgi:hypothetical protein
MILQLPTPVYTKMKAPNKTIKVEVSAIEPGIEPMNMSIG